MDRSQQRTLFKKIEKLTNACCGLSPNCLGTRTRTSPDSGFKKAGIRGAADTWELIIFYYNFVYFLINPNL